MPKLPRFSEVSAGAAGTLRRRVKRLFGLCAAADGLCEGKIVALGRENTDPLLHTAVVAAIDTSSLADTVSMAVSVPATGWGHRDFITVGTDTGGGGAEGDEDVRKSITNGDE